MSKGRANRLLPAEYILLPNEWIFPFKNQPAAPQLVVIFYKRDIAVLTCNMNSELISIELKPGLRVLTVEGEVRASVLPELEASYTFMQVSPKAGFGTESSFLTVTGWTNIHALQSPGSQDVLGARLKTEEAGQ